MAAINRKRTSSTAFDMRFADWDTNGDGKLQESELRNFVGALGEMAFKDGAPRPGWIKFQLARLRSKYLSGDKSYIDEQEFTEILRTTSQLTLFTLDGRKDIAILGAGTRCAVVQTEPAHVRLLTSTPPHYTALHRTAPQEPLGSQWPSPSASLSQLLLRVM